MKKISIILTTLIMVIGCNQKPKEQMKDSSSDIETRIENTEIESEIDNEDEPPFSNTCDCTFNYIGEIKTGENRFDLILSGKGWNPEYYSCSLIWGEMINNEFPPETTITDFRIHLIDIVKITEVKDSTFFDSETFKTKLIATYSKNAEEKYMTCKFDPNKTGKYPKPKQWVE